MMNNPATISILMDNNSVEPSLRTEHGLSMWIEIGDKRILWDTGQTEGLFDNARRLGIDIGVADAIALSHGHYDHTGGLAKVIQSASDSKIYLHPKAAEPKYSFKNGVSRFIGTSRDAQQFVSDRNTAGGVVYVDGKTEILGGVWLTGPVPRTTPCENTGGRFYTDPACTVPDDLPDDQSLYFASSKGMVVVLGCAHSGVVNILNAVAGWTNSEAIYAIIGGMHLVNADTNRIDKTIEVFQRYKIQKIVPLHCTGSDAMQRLNEAFGDRCLSLGAGAQLYL